MPVIGHNRFLGSQTETIPRGNASIDDAEILQEMKAEAAYFITTPSGESEAGSSFAICRTVHRFLAIAEPLFLAFNAKMLSNQPDHRLAGLNL
jgi:hypothetical protein